MLSNGHINNNICGWKIKIPVIAQGGKEYATILFIYLLLSSRSMVGYTQIKHELTGRQGINTEMNSATHLFLYRLYPPNVWLYPPNVRLYPPNVRLYPPNVTYYI